MERTPEGGPPAPRARILRRLIDVAEILGVTVAVALAVKTFVVDAVHVPSASMENTLLAGDFLVVNKFIYGPCTPRYVPFGGGSLPVLHLPGPRDPRRGDVVVFYAPGEEPPRMYVKRLAGQPGDTVMMRGGTLIVNGRASAPPVTAKDARRPAPDFGPVLVPGDCYFVLGDNLDDSLDSRAWGFVPRDRIVGRALMIYWSVDGRSGIRWGRLGTVVR